MRPRLTGLLAPCLATGILIAPALSYDDNWNRTDFWAGEYPGGFTLNANVTTRIRSGPDPQAARDIECDLRKGATYHPWNDDRIKTSGLSFVTLVKKVDYVVDRAERLTLYNESAERDAEFDFKPGDEWTYLTYYGEGTFQIDFKGVRYGADPGLMEISKTKSGNPPEQEHAEDEWMKLTCENGAQGWLLLADVSERPEFDVPDYPEYGKAVDKR